MKQDSLLVIFILAIFSSHAQTTNAPKGQACHKDEVFNINICYPETWRLDDTTKGARFFIFSPLESDTDRFFQNFNLQAKSLAGTKITLKQYVDMNLTGIKDNIQNYKQFGLRYLTQKGVQWGELIYSGDIPSVPYKLKFIQRYAIYRNNAFVITYSSDGESADKYLQTAMKIFNSVTL